MKHLRSLAHVCVGVTAPYFVVMLWLCPGVHGWKSLAVSGLFAFSYCWAYAGGVDKGCEIGRRVWGPPELSERDQ